MTQPARPIQPRIVLFDIGNVIVDWQPIRLYRSLFDDEADARFFCENICTLDWHMAHDRGQTMALNAAPLIAKYPEHTERILAWKTRWLDMFEGYVAGVPLLLARLEENRVPLFGLSNIPAEVADQTFDAFPMIKLLQDIVVSGAEKMVKPDPEIFHLTLRRMGAPDPAEVLFIDDSAVNIAAADALGFQTHHFYDAGRLEKTLIDASLL